MQPELTGTDPPPKTFERSLSQILSKDIDDFCARISEQDEGPKPKSGPRSDQWAQRLHCDAKQRQTRPIVSPIALSESAVFHHPVLILLFSPYALLSTLPPTPSHSSPFCPELPQATP